MAGFSENLFKELTHGSRSALARAISLLESTHPDHRCLARELVNNALTYKLPSPAFRLGTLCSFFFAFNIRTYTSPSLNCVHVLIICVAITGPPGAGKSTFLEAFGLHAIEQHGHRVAVLAIDPSSSITGGSLLGDRTRMLKYGYGFWLHSSSMYMYSKLQYTTRDRSFCRLHL